MPIVETWTFVGGPADGTRQALRQPQQLVRFATTPDIPLRAGSPPPHRVPPARPRGEAVYQRCEIKGEDGVTLAFYIAEGLSFSTALKLLFERYTERRPGSTGDAL